MNKKINDHHLCPVCGKYEFKRRFSYDICPICGWEDDIFDEDDPDDFTGANPMELDEYRAKYAAGWRAYWISKVPLGMKNELYLLTDLQIEFICSECKLSKDQLFHLNEDELNLQVYEAMCEIEEAETLSSDEKESNRCAIASSIVTDLGNVIAREQGLFDNEYSK